MSSLGINLIRFFYPSRYRICLNLPTSAMIIRKTVIVDNAIACIGGLDLCYGRWDTHNFPLADVFPDNNRATLFPGQDYNDARVADFERHVIVLCLRLLI